jgi:RimJ/RimL family protein N-acetyltransferase
MIPTLETERLILRAWKADDFEPYARFMADPDVVRYLSGETLSRGDAWRNMAQFVGHWLLRGYGMWAVERKSDGAFIGRVGLWYPAEKPAVEVGWTLGREYWGQGYASEAARVSMEYGFLTQGVDRLISVIDPRNEASQKVAARLGETRGERLDVVHRGKTYITDVWSISREEWQRRRQG